MDGMAARCRLRDVLVNFLIAGTNTCQERREGGKEGWTDGQTDLQFSRIQSIRVGESMVAGAEGWSHCLCSGEAEEDDSGAPPAFSSVLRAGLQATEWCHSHLWWVFSLPLAQSRNSWRGGQRFVSMVIPNPVSSHQLLQLQSSCKKSSQAPLVLCCSLSL